MRVRDLTRRESPAIAQARARDAQTHARRTISPGPSAGPVRSRARMSEHETSVVVRTRMSNKLGSVGWGSKESDLLVGVRAAGCKNEM
jgi:hypothetical protein